MTTSYQLFKVISPGLFTTVQDRGRYGYQRYGVPVNGVMDCFAATMANLLVGNGDDAAVLECTVAGPTLFALDHGNVSVTGARMPITLNGEAVAGWSSFRVKTGDILEIGQVQSGCRGYIAVTGGFEVPLVMGSRSCNVSAGIGGLNGRPLQKDDRLCRGIGSLPEPRRIPMELVPKYQERIILRAIPGPQDDYFEEGLDTFFSSEFVVSHEANRMGYRLTGPAIKQKAGKPSSIISESSLPGGVQIPPNGQPIILLAEQTVGGYTKIATVISSDLGLIGQAIPGNTIRFQRVDLETAYALKKNAKQIVDHIKTIVELTDTVRDMQRWCAAGKADAIFTAYRNAEREQFLEYSEEVLMAQELFFYKKKGSPFQFDGRIASIHNARIGIVSTISYGQAFDKYRQFIRLDKANQLTHSFQKLAKGRIDLLPSNYNVAEYTIKKMGIEQQVERLPQLIESVPSYIAFSKKRDLHSLREQFDEELRKMKITGEYSQLLQKHGLINFY